MISHLDRIPYFSFLDLRRLRVLRNIYDKPSERFDLSLQFAVRWPFRSMAAAYFLWRKARRFIGSAWDIGHTVQRV